MNGRHVGEIADVLLDGEGRRVLGFDGTLVEGGSCFVPLVAVRSVGPSGIELESILHLVRDVRFYRIACTPASAIVGRHVGCRHAVRGTVSDIAIDLATGEVLAYELADGGTVSAGEATLTADAVRLACSCPT